MYIHGLFVNLVMEHIPFKGPDLHAKRNRPKSVILSAYTRQDPHGFFADAKKQYPSLAKFTNSELSKIFRVIGETFANEVVTNNRGIKLPGGLGGVVVGRTKPTEKTRLYNIDFNTSKQYGFVVRYRNEHSVRTIAKINYTSDTHGCKFRKHYDCTFEPCRNLQRAVSAVMKKEGGYHTYYLAHPKWPITNVFRSRSNALPKPTWRTLKKEREEKELQRYLREEYDEFDFKRSTAKKQK